jgi:hypothetical protein
VSVQYYACGKSILTVPEADAGVLLPTVVSEAIFATVLLYILMPVVKGQSRKFWLRKRANWTYTFQKY